MWSAKSLRANIISKGGRRLSDSDGIRVMFDTAPKRNNYDSPDGISGKIKKIFI